MSLYSKLNAIVDRYKGDLLLVREFVNSTLENLDDLGKILERQKGDLANEDLEALLAVGEALREAADETLKQAANESPGRQKKSWEKRFKPQQE